MSSQKRNIQARRRGARSTRDHTPTKNALLTAGASAALLPSAVAKTPPASHEVTTTWNSVIPDAPAEPVSPPEPHAPPERHAPNLETPTLTELRAALIARARVLAEDTRAWLAARTFEQWLWFAVIALATILRFWQLGAKPLHHDESMHAYFSLAFAQDPSSYSYDPLLHGPFQFHAEGTMFALLIGLQHIFAAGAVGNPWINDTSARFVPALFGIGIVALPYGLRRELGRAGALIAAFLLAVSPTFVYFSRFLREDVYFNFFMFAMVVAAIRFAHERTIKRFVYLTAAAVLAYATFEGFFLTIAIFVGFLAILVAWEFSGGLAKSLPAVLTPRERLFFSRALVFAALGGLAAACGVFALHQLTALSAYINNNPTSSATQVENLENNTVAIMLYASMLIALLVIGALLWQMYQDDARTVAARQADEYAWLDDEDEDNGRDGDQRPISAFAQTLAVPGRKIRALRARIDPERQPLLALLLNISWVHWFIAFVAAWVIFAALYYIVPGGSGATCTSIGQCFQKGIGKGVWQGLYYWIEQQKVARGGQPFYYYLLLMPLYEQLAIVFGVAGIVYSFARPNRFRLFLVFWFVGSLGLYSWAGEKMPWLSMHILLPLMLLAAVSLNWVAQHCYALALRLRDARRSARLEQSETEPDEVIPTGMVPTWVREATNGWRPRVALLSAVGAILLLIPMIHSMLTLAYVDPANGPREMLVYVQTTNDVDTVMAKIKTADEKLYGGKHLLRIGVGAGEEWPFYWYLRDYTNSIFGYGANDQRPVDVAIMLPAYDSNHNDAQTFMSTPAHKAAFTMKQYKLRSWWDESYKPEPCIATKTHACPASANWGSGVGLGAYLSYGSFPPPHAQFDLGRATSRLWNWLWFRQPMGDTGGSYDFTFIVHNGLPIQP